MTTEDGPIGLCRSTDRALNLAGRATEDQPRRSLLENHHGSQPHPRHERMKPRFYGASALLLGLAASSLAPATAAAGPAPDRPARQLIVKFEGNASAQDRAHALKAGGATAVKPLRLADTVELTVSSEHGASAIAGARGVEYVEPNAVARAFDVPDDPHFPKQYGINNTGQTGGKADADIDGVEATDVVRGTGVRVDVLDTGIDADHEDLAAKTDCAVNFTSSPGTDDLYGHGTHVAGIASAITGNGVGVAGTAPEGRLCNVKVLGDDGGGSYAGIANGITWSADTGGKVINMSLGGSVGSRTAAAGRGLRLEQGRRPRRRRRQLRLFGKVVPRRLHQRHRLGRHRPQRRKGGLLQLRRPLG